MGVSRGQFIKLERGERGLTERTIALAAKAFGVRPADILAPVPGSPPPEMLAIETLPASNARRADDREGPPVDLRRLKGPRDVPVHGTGAGGSGGDFRFNGQTIDHAPRPPGIQDKRDVYVVYVVGESMVPRFDDGDPVYVDPKRPPRAGDYVVVELHGPADGEPGDGFVKKLKRRGGGKIVVDQFNPPQSLEWPEEKVKAVHRIIPWVELMGI